MLEVYHAGLTTCSKKVRHCLHEKGLDYKSHYVNLGAFEHHRPEYLALNPNGVVPTLVHDGKVVIESCVINEYLDDVFTDTRLTPEDPYERAKMRTLSKLADEVGLPAVRVPTWTRTKMQAIREMDETTFEKLLAETPLADHRRQFRALRAGGYADELVTEAYGRMDYLYDRGEAALEENGGPWFLGEMFTLADIALLPYLDGFLNTRPELLDTHPRMKDWHARMMARPAVEATYKPSAETQRPAA